MKALADTNSTYSASAISAALLAMMVIAACTAFFLLPQSLRLDEAQSLWETARTPLSILATVAQDVHVPLYHEMLRLWLTIVGDTVESARLMSLLFFLLSIPALYVLGSTAYGQNVGLLAAAFLTLSPMVNWYGDEIRMYTLFMLFAILNQIFFLRLFQRNEPSDWIGYFVTGLVGVYVHYFFFLILGTEALFFFARRTLFPPKSLSRLFVIWVLIALAILPWVSYVLYLGQAQNQQPELPIPTTVNLFSVYLEFLFGFQIDPINAVILSLWPVAIILAFLGLRKRKGMQPETMFFVLASVIPIALAFGISFVVPLFVSRYLIFTAPALFILIARLFLRYPRRIAWLTSGMLAGLMVVMLFVEIASARTPVKEDYRDVVEYLQAHASAQDVVIVSAPFTIYPIEYYYRGPAALETLPEWNRYTKGAIPAFNASTMPQQVQDETAQANYAWLVLSYDQGYQKDIQSYFDQHYAKVFSQTFSPDLTLTAYKIRYDSVLSKLPLGEIASSSQATSTPVKALKSASTTSVKAATTTRR